VGGASSAATAVFFASAAGGLVGLAELPFLGIEGRIVLNGDMGNVAVACLLDPKAARQ